MIRKYVNSLKTHKKDNVAWRSNEVTRIEAFSDAVFAFAITLLIVSLEVPKSSHDLFLNMRGFIPFGICFALMFQIWQTQNIFFRRYGLHDGITMTLNGLLLFVVLFYVYPLKFMFSAALQMPGYKIDINDGAKLWYVYGGGYTAIFVLFALMYLNALIKKEHLQLTKSEVFETQTTLYQNFILIGGGLGSILLTFLVKSVPAAGALSFIIMGPSIGIMHGRRGRKHARLFEGPAQVVEATAAATKA